MKTTALKWIRSAASSLSPVALSVVLMLAASGAARADEADAKRLLKSMSDYLAAQGSISFQYDAVLEVVTGEGQKLGLASSGDVALQRPDKIYAKRAGGFADVSMSFDGTTMTMVGHNLNLYTQIEAPGTLDQLVDVMRNQYGRPLPAADLLLSNAYDELMLDVVDVKDLGSGVVGGVECDSLAFRAEEVDWQIWIAQGERPYPCRYVITSRLISNGPQYSVQISNWKTGDEVAVTDFSFKNPTNAEKVELEDLKGAGDLPGHFTLGEAK
jgi:hypothetical protein